MLFALLCILVLIALVMGRWDFAAFIVAVIVVLVVADPGFATGV